MFPPPENFRLLAFHTTHASHNDLALDLCDRRRNVHQLMSHRVTGHPNAVQVLLASEGGEDEPGHLGSASVRGVARRRHNDLVDMAVDGLHHDQAGPIVPLGLPEVALNEVGSGGQGLLAYYEGKRHDGLETGDLRMRDGRQQKYQNPDHVLFSNQPHGNFRESCNGQATNCTAHGKNTTKLFPNLS